MTLHQLESVGPRLPLSLMDPGQWELLRPKKARALKQEEVKEPSHSPRTQRGSRPQSVEIANNRKLLAKEEVHLVQLLRTFYTLYNPPLTYLRSMAAGWKLSAAKIQIWKELIDLIFHDLLLGELRKRPPLIPQPPVTPSAGPSLSKQPPPPAHFTSEPQITQVSAQIRKDPEIGPTTFNHLCEVFTAMATLTKDERPEAPTFAQLQERWNGLPVVPLEEALPVQPTTVAHTTGSFAGASSAGTAAPESEGCSGGNLGLGRVGGVPGEPLKAGPLNPTLWSMLGRKARHRWRPLNPLHTTDTSTVPNVTLVRPHAWLLTSSPFSDAASPSVLTETLKDKDVKNYFAPTARVSAFTRFGAASPAHVIVSRFPTWPTGIYSIQFLHLVLDAVGIANGTYHSLQSPPSLPQAISLLPLSFARTAKLRPTPYTQMSHLCPDCRSSRQLAFFFRHQTKIYRVPHRSRKRTVFAPSVTWIVTWKVVNFN